jgi:DNA-binding MarR family transcriptional regulator
MVSESGAADDAPEALGGMLLRAWLGYRRRLQRMLADAGFEDREYFDAYVVRLVAAEPGMTVSRLGEQMRTSRQAASKLVAGLVERGHLVLENSATSGREKTVRATPRSLAHLETLRQARGEIDAEIRARLGDQALQAVRDLYDLLADPDRPRPADLWRQVQTRASLLDLDDDHPDHATREVAAQTPR